jgi:hypothetical protein
MNKNIILVLKIFRTIYSKYLRKTKLPKCEKNPENASKIIFDALMGYEAVMIARFGSTELTCLSNYISINKFRYNFLKYIKGECSAWWWEDSILNQMQLWSGFFPPTVEKIEQFCNLMLGDINQIDILGSWLENEKLIENELSHSKKVHLQLLEPFWAETPWTLALKNKKVLVVHPFAKEISTQYSKRKLLFTKEILPDFELKIVKAVQSIVGEKTEYEDWFEALEYMKSEIDKQDYDICLIGAGAYGFHLAAHVKRSGKKAVHLGGALQLLFGIKGKRWEDPDYGVKEWGIKRGSYSGLMNEYWIRPGAAAKPKNSDKVEDSCYW